MIRFVSPEALRAVGQYVNPSSAEAELVKRRAELAEADGFVELDPHFDHLTWSKCGWRDLAVSADRLIDTGQAELPDG